MKLFLSTFLTVLAAHTLAHAANPSQQECAVDLVEAHQTLSAKLPKNAVYVIQKNTVVAHLKLHEFYQLREYNGSMAALAKATGASDYERSPDKMAQLLAEGRLFFQVKEIPSLGANLGIHLFELNADDGRLYWLNPGLYATLNVHDIPTVNEIYVPGRELNIAKFRRGEVRTNPDQLYAVEYRLGAKLSRAYGYVDASTSDRDQWVNRLPGYVNLGFYGFENIESPYGAPAMSPMIRTDLTVAMRPIYRFNFDAIQP